MTPCNVPLSVDSIGWSAFLPEYLSLLPTTAVLPIVPRPAFNFLHSFLLSSRKCKFHQLQLHPLILYVSVSNLPEFVATLTMRFSM